MNTLSSRFFRVSLVLVCGLACVSCEQATTKPVPIETKQLKPVALSSGSSTERSWERSYNKGVELSNQGKAADASYYFSNALGASPGNIEVIEGYCKTMLALSRAEGKSENQSYDPAILQILEGFLQSQIPLVQFGEVEKLLAILTEVQTKINAVESQVFIVKPKYDEWIAEIANGTFDIPKTGEQLIATLETLEDLREYDAVRNAGKDESEASAKIEVLIDKVQNSLNYLTLAELLKARKEMVRESCKTSASIAEYRLQECEQCLREMIALHATDFADDLSAELKSLKDLAEEVIEAKGNENWSEVLVKLDDIKKKRDDIHDPEGTTGEIQRKLENLQEEATLLQNTIPGLTGSALDKALARRLVLGEEATELASKQSQLYNKWVMQNIQLCIIRANEGIKIIINGQEGRTVIGKALIDYLGPIDRRYLTSEVSRCVGEVESLYLSSKHLNPVKDEKAIGEPGNILHTLNKMHEKEKRQLSSF